MSKYRLRKGYNVNRHGIEHYYTPQKRWLFFWFDLYRMSGDVIKFDREQEARDFIERFSKSRSEYIEQPTLPSDTPKQDD